MASGIIESSKKEAFAYNIFEDPMNRCYYETQEYYTSNGTPVRKKARKDRKLHKHFMDPKNLKLSELK